MFRAAQWVVRHKVLVIGGLAVAFMAFGSMGDEQKSVSPWGSDAAQQAAVQSNTSLGAKAFGSVAGAVKQYAGVDISTVAPESLRKQTVDNWQNTADAARRANGN